jgi:transposase
MRSILQGTRTRRQKSANALATRARIVLASARGESNTDIAARLRLSMPTVGKWRTHYVERGLDGLLDEPRPGAQRTVSDEDVERAVTLTLERKVQDLEGPAFH